MFSYVELTQKNHIQLNIERGYGIMNGENENGTPESELNQPISKVRGLWAFRNISKPTLGLLTFLIGIFGSQMITIGLSNLHQLPLQMENLTSQVNELTRSFGDFSQEMRRETKDLGTVDSDFIKEFYELKGMVSASTVILPASPEFSDKAENTLSAPDLPGKAPDVQFVASTVVARSADGKDIEAEDIANCRVLMPYKSGDQDVVFYGQINENGRWDGNCVLNTYRNGKLELITDAVYLNGKLISCKQVFYYTMSSGQVVWAYADRLSEECFSTGSTWLYLKEGDCPQDFKLDDVTADKVLTADGFREKINAKKIAYYYGNTSDGKFNDTTGNAYMIHYFENGAIKLLYSGNFIDGLCCDDTGTAWQIARDITENYEVVCMCYKGAFKNNEQSFNPKKLRRFATPLSSLSAGQSQEFWQCWKDENQTVFLGNKMTQQDIDLIIGARNFKGDGELNWKPPYEMI